MAELIANRRKYREENVIHPGSIWRSSALGLAVIMAAGTAMFSGADVVLASAPYLSDSQVSEIQDVVTTYKDAYGGLTGDPATNVVTIYQSPGATRSRVSGASARIGLIRISPDARGARGAKHWKLRIVVAGPSLATLERVETTVTSTEPWRSDLQDTLVSYGIDPMRHAVVIGVEHMTAQKAILGAFGNLVIFQVEQRPTLFCNRLLDCQPYWGGSRVIYGTTFCTGAFPASDAGNAHRGMLTAGHCFALNTIVKQGYCDSTCHSSGNMGKVTHRSWGNGLPDAEFMDSATVGTSVEAAIYEGVYNSGSGQVVRGLGSDFVGLTVCFDGTVTGENCHGVVKFINRCINVLDHGITVNVCNQNTAVSSNGSRMCQPGDSGSPVYIKNPNVEAHGILSSGDQTTFTTCNYTDIYSAENSAHAFVLVS